MLLQVLSYYPDSNMHIDKYILTTLKQFWNKHFKKDPKS